MKKKVLIITNHRKDRAPGQRFRFEQYLTYLEENGIEIDFSFLINEKNDSIFYSEGNYIRKVFILLQSCWKRLNNVFHKNEYDVIFIFREALMLGTTFFERRFAKSKAKVIFDFDDAIWMNQESKSSAPNKNLTWLKNPDKTKGIIALSDMVIVGNQYLADYAEKYNNNVVIIPTTIDTDEYQPKKTKNFKKEKVCIGWSGSKTTIDHFEEALPALKIIKEKYGKKVTFKVIGDGDYEHKELGIKGDPWRKETELEDLHKIDIGIMPLPDDEWAKGKCGLKGLQYMAMGIPTLMSPVGVNTEIIHDGENGFLPKTEDEWVERLSLLIEDDNSRRIMGISGRKTVEVKYSVEGTNNKFLKLIIE